MTSKKDTSLSDIGEAISDLATQMDARFEKVNTRFDQVNERLEDHDRRFDAVDAELYGIRKEQREMRECLGRIDSRILGIESDIKEIYDRIVALEKKSPRLTASEAKELIRKVDSVMVWAKKVSQKTGIAMPK